ncbi:MAG: hypothetical protein AVDCRST_MAG79-641 [uncultured Thermoleophilia bacterium]|uniref:Putative zinc-finger domain-containing protein n=1 Tax=uncultured Thermoleophilia bacterium TaxID=1497501 RepID=A0A6J4TM95_9ACTN|nr:MAG: hypothetical protein AVDCRST_MAG79-641 [uncultured Thermoleophilia bacterium]
MSDESLHRRPDAPPQACLVARLTATAALDGEAAETELQALRVHLAACAACRAVVARHESLVAAVREAPLERPRAVGPLARPRPSLRQTGRALLVAAALAAVALVGAFVSESRRDGGPAPAQSGPLIAERPTDTEAPPG